MANLYKNNNANKLNFIHLHRINANSSDNFQDVKSNINMTNLSPILKDG